MAPSAFPAGFAMMVLPYEIPDPNGTCHLLGLPDEVLAGIFTRLDRVSLTRCSRLCKILNELLTHNSVISLHHLLLCNALRVNPAATQPSPNPHQVPPSPAQLLAILRERLTRFRNFTPRSRSRIEFGEPDGTLYEYLEGVLLRGVGGRRVLGTPRVLPRELAVYDLRKLGEWEDAPVNEGDGVGVEDGMEEVEEEETTESEAGKGIRSTKKLGFEISEFAVDPGADLLLVVEVRTAGHRRWTMHFHLLTLSTFEPHPRAAQTVLDWPLTMQRKEISLGFQICDDGIFVLNHNSRSGPHDQLCGWQWTTGRLAVTIRAFPTTSFESFILLSPSAFVIPTIITHLDPTSETAEELDNPADLSWTHHLHLYAFPPFSAIRMPASHSEPMPPPHTAVHIATLDLPKFYVNIMEEIPPPRLTIRTDPPPRHTFPIYPEHAPAPFQPTPESGLIIMEVFCQLPPDEVPHFVMCCLKSTLLQYLPAPTSPLLFQAFPRPAPVVQWQTLAPRVRMFGPDLEPSSWVCYVYQNRYVIPRTDAEDRTYLRLYDFDPLRVRKEKCDRANDTEPIPPPIKSRTRSLLRRASSSLPAHPLDCDRHGVHLVTAETLLPGDRPLLGEIRTGKDLPYLYVEREGPADTALLDGERVVAVENGNEAWGRASLEIMEF